MSCKAFFAVRWATRGWRNCQPLTSAVTVGQSGQFSTKSPRDGARTSEYAYEISCANMRYGNGATWEVGMDLKNLNAQNVCVMTDKIVADLTPVKVTLESLDQAEIPYKLYSNVRVEPSDESLKDAIKFAAEGYFDSFVAVGGGSVIDTCKVANLYYSQSSSSFLDFISTPIGRGKAVTRSLKPLIAVPTTAGTGSEITRTAAFDYLSLKTKIGIVNHAIRPRLGILDPVNLVTVPSRVAVYTGLDVVFRAIESLTSLSYYDRKPQPENPSQRPIYQGSNHVSDHWSMQALRLAAAHLRRSAYNEDMEARSQMLLASYFAGIGSDNTGVHLCHAMACPIATKVKDFRSSGYSQDHPLVPHGLAVAITAPAVFAFTAPTFPERHVKIAELLGADIRNIRRADAGKLLGDVVCRLLKDLECPNGLEGLGYTSQDIPALVQGTLSQNRMLNMCPRPVYEEDLTKLFYESLTLY